LRGEFPHVRLFNEQRPVADLNGGHDDVAVRRGKDQRAFACEAGKQLELEPGTIHQPSYADDTAVRGRDEHLGVEREIDGCCP